jgi:hypothetical protein
MHDTMSMRSANQFRSSRKSRATRDARAVVARCARDDENAASPEKFLDAQAVRELRACSPFENIP